MYNIHANDVVFANSGSLFVNFLLKCKISALRCLFFCFFLRRRPGLCHYFVADAQPDPVKPLAIDSVVFKNIVMKTALSFLAPFDKQGFIADYFSFEFGDVDIGDDDPLLDEFFAIQIAAVQVYRTDERFENVSVDVLAKMGEWNLAFDEAREVEIAAQFVEVFAAHDLRAHFGQVTFIARRNLAEKMRGNDRSQHRIAKELQPFKIDRISRWIGLV